MDQRSGRRAEDRFKELCSQAGLTCNKALEDDHGWDFIAEIPSLQTNNLPADKVPAPKPVLVQVKSTNGKSATTKLKVSNALKLAKNELPCFVILFHVCGDGSERIYVRHFWKELIERALKRGRKASAARKSTNKTMITVSFNTRDEHSGDLIDWMQRTVSKLPEEYGSKKRTLGNELGYIDYKDGRNYRAEVTLDLPRGIEDLVDLQLGLIDDLPVLYIKLVDSRFGIDAPDPIEESEGGRFQWRLNSARECNMVLQSSNGDVISLAATVKCPQIPRLPPENFKCIIETWLFSVVLQYGRNEVSFHDSHINKKLPVEHLAELASFLSWNSGPISMKIVRDGVSPITFDGRFSAMDNCRSFKTIADVARTMREIQSRAGVTAVNLSLRDLQNSIRDLSAFHTILTAKDMKLTISEIQHGNPEYGSHILAYCDFDVGGFTFLVVFDAPITERSRHEDRIVLNCGNLVWRDYLVGENGDAVRSTGRERYVIQEASDVADYLSFGDFGDILRSGHVRGPDR